MATCCDFSLRFKHNAKGPICEECQKEVAEEFALEATRAEARAAADERKAAGRAAYLERSAATEMALWGTKVTLAGVYTNPSTGVKYEAGIAGVLANNAHRDGKRVVKFDCGVCAWVPYGLLECHTEATELGANAAAEPAAAAGMTPAAAAETEPAAAAEIAEDRESSSTEEEVPLPPAQEAAEMTPAAAAETAEGSDEAAIRAAITANWKEKEAEAMKKLDRVNDGAMMTCLLTQAAAESWSPEQVQEEIAKLLQLAVPIESIVSTASEDHPLWHGLEK